MLESDNVTVDVRYPGAFDTVVCPVCGERSWTLVPAEGAFCDDCNCRLELGPTNGDPGFIATFDADYCHPSHWEDAPDEEHLIPDDPANGRKAYAKFMGSLDEESEYGLYWFELYARQNPDHDYDGNWRPSWEREDYTRNDQRRWSPFEGHISGDDAPPAQATVEVAVATSNEE